MKYRMQAPNVPTSQFQPRDYVGPALQSFQAGQKMGQQRAMNKAASRYLMSGGADQEAAQMLSQMNPDAYLKATQQIQAQQQQQYQRTLQEAKIKSDLQERFGKALAKAGNAEEAAQIERMFMQDPLFRMVYGSPSAEGLAADYSAAKVLYGSGMAEMDFKDVQSGYNAQPVVKEYNTISTKVSEIENLLAQDSAPAHEGALKALAKLVDPGIVTESDRAAMANRGFGNLEAFVNQLKALEGGKLDDKMKAQVLNAANALLSSKQQGVLSLQDRYKQHLGAHRPEEVFMSTGVFNIEDAQAQLVDEPAAYENEEIDSLVNKYASPE